MGTTSLDRRKAIAGLAGLAAAIAAGLPAVGRAATGADRPDPKDFQSGDLVWPKKPGQLIPYAGTPEAETLTGANELRELDWTEERIAFIRSARSNQSDDLGAVYERNVADTVELMTYTDFFHRYAADVAPQEFVTHGVGDVLYVGHVGIIDIDETSGEPHVIEAVYGKAQACTSCVQRISYAAWLAGRHDALVWHGRLRNAEPSARKIISAAARSQIGKPYKFFGFDLLDDRGFYCSKLVWYSVYKAMNGLALDGTANSRRLIWFSPLQAMKCKANVEILTSPGNYRNV